MHPFHKTGLDYTRPILMKDRKGRKTQTTNCYISLFICFSTQAIYLELVSDLTTECFIAAFSRFVFRREKPSHMYSDNGKTFVGASSELTDLGKFLLLHKDLVASSVPQKVSCGTLIQHILPTWAACGRRVSNPVNII